MEFDPSRSRLLQLVQDRIPPTDLKNASLAIGRNHAYLHQFVFKGTPKQLPDEIRLALAEFLGCEEEELKPDGPLPPRHVRHEERIMPPSLVKIPELDVRASAGPGAIIDGDVQAVADWFFSDPVIRHEFRARAADLRLLALDGDSMEPMLPSGSRIMIDVSKRVPSPPGVFVIWDGYGLVAKRLEHIPNTDPPTVVIKSVNPAYETYQRTAEEVNIVGRVIWAAQRL
ncbi:MAG: peptidase S24 [Azospirillum sp.]|nr:peptidase S24 [Azospirillum sp.]